MTACVCVITDWPLTQKKRPWHCADSRGVGPHTAKTDEDSQQAGAIFRQNSNVLKGALMPLRSCRVCLHANGRERQ